jgi:hypothetical protein
VGLVPETRKEIKFDEPDTSNNRRETTVAVLFSPFSPKRSFSMICDYCHALPLQKERRRATNRKWKCSVHCVPILNNVWPNHQKFTKLALRSYIVGADAVYTANRVQNLFLDFSSYISDISSIVQPWLTCLLEHIVYTLDEKMRDWQYK